MIYKHEIKSYKDIEKIKDKWQYLENGSDMTIFQGFQWNLLLVKQFFNNRYNRLFCKIVIYESENFIAPLVVQPWDIHIKWLGRKKGIYLLGIGSYSDYMNIVYKNLSIEDIEELFVCLMRDYPHFSINLDYIRYDTELKKILEKLEIHPSREFLSVAIPIEENKEKYILNLSKSTRQNLRTSLNRINRDGYTYDIEIIEGILQEKLINELIHIHLERVLKKNSNESSMKKRISSKIKQLQLRYTELSNNIVKAAMLSMKQSILIIVKLNGYIAGYLFGFKERKTVRIIQNCVVDKYKFYSPMFRGTYDYILKEIEEQNLFYIDFTRGGEEYKYKLGGKDTKLYSYNFLITLNNCNYNTKIILD